MEYNSIGNIIGRINWEHFKREEFKTVHLSFPDAEKKLTTYLQRRFRDEASWFNGYDDFCDWLKDNKGKGLVLYGEYSTGKTILVREFFFHLFREAHEKNIEFFPARELNDLKELELITQKYYKIIDNIDSEKIIRDYGNRYEPFSKVVFDCIYDSKSYERDEYKFLIITTNLMPCDIQARYGVGTLEELSKLCRFIEFKHDNP